MMYGPQLSMPVDVMLSLPPGEQYTAGQYTQKLQEKIQFAYEMAQVVFKRTAVKQTQLYYQFTFGESMKAGNVVWYANKLRKKGVKPPSSNPSGRVLVLLRRCIMRSSPKYSYPPEKALQCIQIC